MEPDELRNHLAKSKQRENLYIYTGKMIPNGFLIGEILSLAIWGWRPPYILLFTEGTRWMLM